MPERTDQQARGGEPEESRLEPRRVGELGQQIRPHTRRVLRRVAGDRRVGGPSPGGEGEINPLSCDRIDQAGGVADHAPVSVPASSIRRRLPAPSDGIGHEYGSSRAPSAIRVWRIHAAALARKVAAVDPASACAQIPMAR